MHKVINISNELKKLKLPIRNKVRALVFLNMNDTDAVKSLERLRANCSVNEILQIERTMRVASGNEVVIPEHFPSRLQTKNNYFRLKPLPLEKQLKKLELLVIENSEMLNDLIILIKELNLHIADKELLKADKLIGNIIERFGYSHFILRKSVLVSVRANENEAENLVNINSLLNKDDANYSNMISSLIHTYEGKQNVISVKRSMMNTKDEGKWNKYSRDMLRVPFHPHAKNVNDLEEMLESNLQSSLLDAILMAKMNQHLFAGSYEKLQIIFKNLHSTSPTINKIAKIYLDSEDSETDFYIQSSAWFEDTDVLSYRILQDHFYDDPEAVYFSLKDNQLLNQVYSWVLIKEIEELALAEKLTTHSFSNLQLLESNGAITRTSVFNYICFLNKGNLFISESNLIKLMGMTQNLDRTIDVESLKKFASNLDSEISKILLFLLIAKKSKKESESFYLRRVLQNKVLLEHESKLINFVEDLSSKSTAIAEYIYEVFNEDFISLLSLIIPSATEITETRAELHRWMGKISGDQRYFDRARNLIIDNQINIIRDEINDNRVYVDASRFLEWMEDQVLRELNTLLLLMEEHADQTIDAQPLIITIIENCYREFCSNKYFGISSYIGRRIRHGTFKGNLYFDIISIEKEYEFLGKDGATWAMWQDWKLEFEKNVDEIVDERLHVKTSQKRKGFLSPQIDSDKKLALVKACMKDMQENFKKDDDIRASLLVLGEYCWRIAEVDLNDLGSYLKGQKSKLINLNLISSIKNNSDVVNRGVSKDFGREIQNRIDERLTIICGWFKRPKSISPQASLGLLYRAVVSEVKLTFTSFHPKASLADNEQTIIGGNAYHTMYDALYVILYNAAKHGKVNGVVEEELIVEEISPKEVNVILKIRSQNDPTQSDEEINRKLFVSMEGDIENAQLDENRSGIRKLYNLQNYNSFFKVLNIESKEGFVDIAISSRVKYA